MRKHEEAWVFEDPVTESIAPGYFEIVDKPMDYSTVEKKVEEQVYKSKDEVSGETGLDKNIVIILNCSVCFRH